MGVFYEIGITRGELRNETDGSTDLAAWIPTSDIGNLERAVIIDVALDLYYNQPATGHVERIEVGDLLRY